MTALPVNALPAAGSAFSAAGMPKIAVIIPSYRVKKFILPLLASIGPEVSRIYVVDDCCPEGTGAHVSKNCRDSRVVTIQHPENRGVGGAMATGYKAALADGMDIVVKMDGDGQMSPTLIPGLVQPIVEGRADYVKGNRFFSLDSLNGMPPIRLFGNSVLCFLNKLVSGYWNIMDPTNGFTAIEGRVLATLPLDKVDNGYFFESDILFRLNTVRAVVCEVPMQAVYGDEESSLRIGRVIRDFPRKYLRCLTKRVFYNYFLRDFNVCSLQIVTGTVLMTFGTVFGLVEWWRGSVHQLPATTGTVMIAALPVILGFQLLLSAVGFDVANVPRVALHPMLQKRGRAAEAVEQPESAPNFEPAPDFEPARAVGADG